MNFSEAQLQLDFLRCHRCGKLDRRDWFFARMGCRKCRSRAFIDAVSIEEEEAEKIASGWFEDEKHK